MFIPTNSDGQVFVNLRKKIIEKKFKKKKKNLSPQTILPTLLSLFDLVFVFFFILYVGPTCPLILLLGPFQPRNNLFCPGFNFIYPN